MDGPYPQHMALDDLMKKLPGVSGTYFELRVLIYNRSKER
jgi:hypothetical protein